MSTTKRFVVAALGAALALGSLQACGSSDSGGGEGLDGKKVALLSLSPSCATCAAFTSEVTDDLEAEGVEVTVATSEFGEAADQIEKFNQALSTKPDGIVIWPTDSTSIIPALVQARTTNPDTAITVAVYKPDTDEEGLYSAFVGADDSALGAAQAQALVDGLEALGKEPSGGILQIEGAPGAATTLLRQQGFEDALPEVAPDLTVLESQTANWDQTEATSVASAMFSKHSDEVVGVFAHSDVMLKGAILAAERAGLVPGEDFVAVGIDCDVEGYENIKAGKQFATGLWDPYAIGESAAAQTLALLQGDDVELETYVDSPQIEKDNLADCESALTQ